MKKTNPDIAIWRFENAPGYLKDLSNNGGDEDWIAVLKKDFYDNHYIGFLEQGSPFGCCDVEKHTYDNEGLVILIGSHA